MSRFQRLRWILVVGGAAVILMVSYWWILPHRGGFPDDHGLAALANYDMPQPIEDYYACLISWAVANSDDLWITDDFILQPRPERDGSFRGDFKIEASGLTGVSGGAGEGSLYVQYRFNNSRSYPFPCGNPSHLSR